MKDFALLSLTENERLALQDLKQRVAAQLGDNLVALKLFGSKARGEAHPASDLDVAVVVRQPSDEVEDVVWDAVVDLLGTYDVYLETITFSADEYRQSLDEQWPFMLNLEREGIAL